MDTTTDTTTDTTAAPARSRSRRRLGLRLGAVALAAGIAGPALAGTALAETPPAPSPGMQIALPGGGLQPNLDLGTVANDGAIWSTQVAVGDVWSDITFVSNRPNLVVQFSTTAPTMVNGKLSVGAVSPQYLTGTPVQADPVPVTGQYRYTVSRQGLTPDTRYYALVTIPGTAAQAPNQATIEARTKVRHVTVRALDVHVSDDADPGLLGKGEINFGQWITPADPFGEAIGMDYSSIMSIGTGGDVDLAASDLVSTTTTRRNDVTVVLQGIEHDGAGFCPTGVFTTPTVGALECGYAAYAMGTVKLPTGKYGAKHSQVIHVQTTNPGGLKFQASLLVETTAG